MFPGVVARGGGLDGRISQGLWPHRSRLANLRYLGHNALFLPLCSHPHPHRCRGLRCPQSDSQGLDPQRRRRWVDFNEHHLMG